MIFVDNEAKEYLEKVHESDFAMLCEVDRICKKYGIQYFLHGGTFLGAVRHQDFIPWDDDVDILFLREDYERFLEVFEAEADKRFSLLRFEKFPQFFDFISKVADTSLTYEGTAYGAEEFYENRYSHPTMDLFVFDAQTPNHGLQLIKLKLLYALAMGHRPYIDYGKFSGPMKIVAFILSRIGKCISFKHIAKRYIRIQKAGGPTKDAKMLFISNEQPDPRYWGLDFAPEHLVNGPDVGIIRGKEFPIPRLHDKWLKKTYGDYMSLPPIEKQVPMHVKRLSEMENTK